MVPPHHALHSPANAGAILALVHDVSPAAPAPSVREVTQRAVADVARHDRQPPPESEEP
jgi:hypothetical protein